jgi:hypothetical protein
MSKSLFLKLLMYYFYDFDNTMHTMVHVLPIGYFYSYFKDRPSFYAYRTDYLGARFLDMKLIFVF